MPCKRHCSPCSFELFNKICNSILKSRWIFLAISSPSGENILCFRFCVICFLLHPDHFSYMYSWELVILIQGSYIHLESLHLFRYLHTLDMIIVFSKALSQLKCMSLTIQLIYIETATKPPPFSRRHSQKCFLQRKCLNIDWNFTEISHGWLN